MAFSGALNPLPNELRFSDLNVTFRPHPVTGKVGVLENNDAVKRALRNLILTNKFERPYEPLFGGDILSLLFENEDDFLQVQVKNRIEEAIRNFEPRVNLLDVQVKNLSDINTVEIKIFFSVINQREPAEFTVVLERIR